MWKLWNKAWRRLKNSLNISLALEEGGKIKEVRYSHQGAILSMVLVIFPNVKKFWRFLKVICWEIFFVTVWRCRSCLENRWSCAVHELVTCVIFPSCCAKMTEFMARGVLCSFSLNTDLLILITFLKLRQTSLGYSVPCRHSSVWGMLTASLSVWALWLPVQNTRPSGGNTSLGHARFGHPIPLPLSRPRGGWGGYW